MSKRGLSSRNDARKRAVASTMRRVVWKAAPNAAARVRKLGPGEALARTLSPARLSPSRRRQDFFEDIVWRRSRSEAINLAVALAGNREVAGSLTMLDAVLREYPDSSRAALVRARVRPRKNSTSDATSDFVRAIDGDQESVRLDEIVLIAADCLELEQYEMVAAHVRLVGARWEPAAYADATEVMAAVERYRDSANGPVISPGDSPSHAVLSHLFKWCTNDRRWEVAQQISAWATEQEPFDKIPRNLAIPFAKCLRAGGDLTSALAAVRRDDSPEAKLLARIIEAELDLRENGWVEPVRSNRTSGARGSMGYLLHNSLPYTSGGYATRSHGLLTGMVSRGWDVTAVTRPRYPVDLARERRRFQLEGSPSHQNIDGVRYERILERPIDGGLVSRVETYSACVARIAKVQNWAVIHAASNHPNGLAAVEAGARLGLPSVYEVRGLWELTRMSRDPIYGESEHFEMAARLEADACRMADHSFAITEAVRDIMVDRGVPRNHISILPNGVDVERFTPLSPNRRLKSKLGLNGKVVIGYVGSVVDYEGLELLVEAIAIIRAAGAPVAFLLVGDGEASGSVQHKIDELGIRDITVAPGRVPHEQVEDYYSVIDIAPFPRLPLPVTEAVSPLKPFEAMAMAKPIVVSSVAALEEIVTEGLNGRIFRKGDSSDLARVLSELIEDEPGRLELGMSARKWVEENRSWRTISERIDVVYEKLGVTAP